MDLDDEDLDRGSSESIERKLDNVTAKTLKEIGYDGKYASTINLFVFIFILFWLHTVSLFFLNELRY